MNRIFRRGTLRRATGFDKRHPLTNGKIWDTIITAAGVVRQMTSFIPFSCFALPDEEAHFFCFSPFLSKKWGERRPGLRPGPIEVGKNLPPLRFGLGGLRPAQQYAVQSGPTGWGRIRVVRTLWISGTFYVAGGSCAASLRAELVGAHLPTLGCEGRSPGKSARRPASEPLASRGSRGIPLACFPPFLMGERGPAGGEKKAPRRRSGRCSVSKKSRRVRRPQAANGDKSCSAATCAWRNILLRLSVCEVYALGVHLVRATDCKPFVEKTLWVFFDSLSKAPMLPGPC